MWYYTFYPTIFLREPPRNRYYKQTLWGTITGTPKYSRNNIYRYGKSTLIYTEVYEILNLKHVWRKEGELKWYKGRWDQNGKQPDEIIDK
jgi:hypothetical protein